MRIYTREETRNALPFSHLIPALEDMFRRGCTAPRRHLHNIGTPDIPVTMLIMPAWSDAGFLGIKTVNIAPNNASRSLPGLFSTYMLYDRSTGEPVAQLDGNEITSRRTAAASALAAKLLARPSSTRLTLLGAGRVGSLIPYAYREVLPIEEVAVWDIDHAASERLVGQLNQDGFIAHVVEDLEQAVGWADAISCATLSTKPLIEGAWLTPGSHLDLIGSFTPEMREADTNAIVSNSLFIDTEEALEKSGDLLQPIQLGDLNRDAVIGTLEELCRCQCPARRSEQECTVFKAVGTALEDLAAATLVHHG
ncbi:MULTISPECIES: ornithine cyclodeaminase family protein [unclassified Halomonas]|uniref:ornithine cyclodeaminase family protein n=1 Tax=unclassified Halomonas TaxID=2609666 RepID=UPI0009909600|nr:MULTISPECIES: ornithine cyclodeaminase family protein [unclassified Halomonas]AQU82174.1 ornithine cyclodeaminase [Halomonas sp. 'Soap Lake \